MNFFFLTGTVNELMTLVPENDLNKNFDLKLFDSGMDFRFVPEG